MNQIRRNFNRSHALLLMLIIFILPFSVQAFGLSPSNISVSNILRDSTQARTVVLTRDDPQEDQLFIVAVRGAYSHYVDAPEEIIIPAGQKTAVYSFDIAPESAALGSYEVILEFKPQNIYNEVVSEDDNKVEVLINVIENISLRVNFKVVGGEVVDFKVSNLQVTDTEIKEPVFASINVLNTGNVEWRPDEIIFTFVDTVDETNIVSTEVLAEDIEITKPGENKKHQYELEARLFEGKYRSQAVLVYNNEIVETLKSSNFFNVYPEGTLQQKGEFLSISTSKKSYKINEKIKLEALFKNIGEIPVKAILVTEIYKKDELIDILRSKDYIVDLGEEKIIPQIIQLDSNGAYTLSAYFEYGNKITESKSIAVIVKGFLSGFNLSIILIVISIIILTFVILYRRKKESIKV